jgi:branched-chain amino acid aminotransferase
LSVRRLGARLRHDREAGVELEQRLVREMLHCADEVFLTDTAAEITPVRAIDGQPVGRARAGPW